MSHGIFSQRVTALYQLDSVDGAIHPGHDQVEQTLDSLGDILPGRGARLKVGHPGDATEGEVIPVSQATRNGCRDSNR